LARRVGVHRRLSEPELAPISTSRSYLRCATADRREARIARSGLAALAPEPHRTTMQPAVNRCTEPAICAAPPSR